LAWVKFANIAIVKFKPGVELPDADGRSRMNE